MRSAATSILAATVVGLGFSTDLASAADLPVKARPAPVVAAPVATGWSGFYVGAHVGYGWVDSDTSTSFLPSAAAFDGTPFS